MFYRDYLPFLAALDLFSTPTYMRAGFEKTRNPGTKRRGTPLRKSNRREYKRRKKARKSHRRS